jgi:hypothetical protein
VLNDPPRPKSTADVGSIITDSSRITGGHAYHATAALGEHALANRVLIANLHDTLPATTISRVRIIDRSQRLDKW